MSAPLSLMTSCGAVTLPLDFDIFSPRSSKTKPWVSTTSKGARPRVPQDSKSEEWNQPRCWSEPSRYITASGPPSTLRRVLRSSRTSSVKAWVEPESNQKSRMSSIFCQDPFTSASRTALDDTDGPFTSASRTALDDTDGSLASLPRKRSRAPVAYQ